MRSVWWVLLYPNGAWWCEKAIATRDLADRTAAEWNSNLPRGERDRLRVVRVRICVDLESSVRGAVSANRSPRRQPRW